MERITPLAKILAEANGIEWENLPGTGDGGTIVEQDILNYLSRIMSGEEEPPSTPVDAPPPDWNGEEIPAGGGMFNADMLKGAGVDADIAAFVEQTRPAAQAAPSVPEMPPVVPVVPAPQMSTSFTPAPLDADEFELDDAPAAPAPAPVTAPPPAPAPAAGLGSLLSRLYKTDGAAAETQTPTEPGPAPAAPLVTPQPTPTAPTPEAEVAAPMPAPATAAPTPAAPLAPAAVTPAFAAPAAPQPSFTPSEVTPAAAALPAAPQPAPVMPAPAAPMAVSAPVMARPADVPEHAAWFGVYLRRDTDVVAARDLAEQLSEALEQDVTLALLVARAAQRHASLLNLSRVALDGAQGMRSVGEGHLREVLSDLNTDAGDSGAATADLLVVDAGAYGLDDLHYPQTLSLSVGREHAGRVSLSLNGDVETAQAAQFLARVAETLEKPIVLVL